MPDEIGYVDVDEGGGCGRGCLWVMLIGAALWGLIGFVGYMGWKAVFG